MQLLIVAAVLANWNYGEFVSDPIKPRPVALQEHPADSQSPAFTPVPPTASASAPTQEATPPAAPAAQHSPENTVTAREPSPALTPQPMLWRLADSNGQFWEHADPAWLSRWVAQRNASLAGHGVRGTLGPIAPPTSWTCTPSGCDPRSP
jgi:DNA segregation ATPase FtsK/SpoIIIE-like protein